MITLRRKIKKKKALSLFNGTIMQSHLVENEFPPTHDFLIKKFNWTSLWGGCTLRMTAQKCPPSSPDGRSVSLYASLSWQSFSSVKFLLFSHQMMPWEKCTHWYLHTHMNIWMYSGYRKYSEPLKFFTLLYYTAPHIDRKT